MLSFDAEDQAAGKPTRKGHGTLIVLIGGNDRVGPVTEKECQLFLAEPPLSSSNMQIAFDFTGHTSRQSAAVTTRSIISPVSSGRYGRELASLAGFITPHPSSRLPPERWGHGDVGDVKCASTRSPPFAPPRCAHPRRTLRATSPTSPRP